MSLSHLADGCRTPEEAGFCQTKRTPERLNVTRLFSRLPLRDPSSSYLKTVSFPFIPVCCFKPPANLFCLLRPSSRRVLEPLKTRETETRRTARKGGGNM